MNIGSLPILAALALFIAAPALAVNCEDNIPPSNPDSIYTDHDDGTVTDTRTGLMWAKCAEGQTGNDCASGTATTYTWANALALAEGSELAGYKDWRLPNLKELRSLVEECRKRPAINETVFPNADLSYFWSGSPGADNSDRSRAVMFEDGSSATRFRDSDIGGLPYVRLVRGGQSFDSFDSFDASGTYTPDDIGNFSSQTAATTTTVTANDTKTLSGLTTVTGIKVEDDVNGNSSPQYRVSRDGGNSWGQWTTDPGVVANDHQIEVRLTSADTVGVTRTATLTVGGKTADFAVTTAAVPDAPTSVTAVAGDAQATVTWTAPNDGGSAITGYNVTGSPGGSCTPDPATATTCTVTGLTNGTAYTFTVTATNVVGTGSASSASNAVTPLPSGACGSADSVATTTAPASNLCQELTTASSVASYEDRFDWTCTGISSSVANCSAPRSYSVTPSAGSGGNLSPAEPVTVPYNQTISFNVTANSGYRIDSVTGCGGSLAASTYTTGAITSACTVSATFQSTGGGGPSPINGRCGNAEGEAFTEAPTTNLCASGSASAVAGTGPWSWTCAGLYGGTDASCTATTAPLDGACGSANGQTFTTTPSSGLCSTGSASTIAGTGPWFWSCDGRHGGASAWCGANRDGLPPYNPDPDIPPDEIWSQLPDEDSDSIPDAVEGQVVSRDGETQGDGNGDGIPDAEQDHIASFTGSTCPETGRPRFVTLAVDAGLQLAEVTRRAAPDDLPAAITLTCGEFAFKVNDLDPGASVAFSVYVEDTVPVDGYYYRNLDTGAWDNLAGAPVSVGVKKRLDFSLQDGGPYDGDRAANGTLVDPGGPGFADSFSITATSSPSAGGSVSCAPNPVAYGEDSQCTATATANSGYSFSSWGGACSGSTNPCTLSSVKEVKTVSASFTLNSINGQCGSAEGEAFAVAPSSNLCSAGTPSAVSGSGPWSWTCSGLYGGTDASCTATTAEVDGRCGSASATTFATRPSSGLCASGTAGAVAGTGPWFWNCSGQYGGASTWCGANAEGLQPYDPDPDIPPDEIWSQLPDEDTDGIPDAVEGQVLSLDGQTQGDGNGDGIPDVEQAHVSAFNGSNCPERARPRFVTLAAPVGTTLVDVIRRDAPDDLPADLILTCGEIAFEVPGLEPGATLDFSVYIENDVGVDGYYYRNQDTGAWDNLASAIVEDGIKTRIDFAIQDGGPYDADGLPNGSILDPGGPGHQGDQAQLVLPVGNGLSLYDRLSVYGQTGQERVRLQGGQGSWLDQNIDGIELPGVFGDYRFSQRGNMALIEGPNQRAQLVVQGPPDGTAIATSEGGTQLHFDGNQLRLGNQALGSSPRAITAVSLSDSLDPGAKASGQAYSNNISPNRILLQANAHITLAEAAEVYGQQGLESVGLIGTPGVEIDQNIERVQFDGALSAYRFRQQGNGLEVRRDNRRVATVRAQGDRDGTQLIFTDHNARLWYDGTQMRLGAAAVPSDDWGVIEGGSL